MRRWTSPAPSPRPAIEQSVDRHEFHDWPFVMRYRGNARHLTGNKDLAIVEPVDATTNHNGLAPLTPKHVRSAHPLNVVGDADLQRAPSLDGGSRQDRQKPSPCSQQLPSRVWRSRRSERTR